MILFVLVVFLAGCESYPNGAPTGICSVQKQRPYHGRFFPQTSPPPYRIYTNSSSYRPNDPINITISGDGASFKGFFFTADTTSASFNGRVDNVTSNVRTAGNCGMTHTDNSPKTSITFLWTPPELVHIGNVQFISLVVTNFSTFWNNIRSEVLEPDFTVYETHKSVWTKMYAEAQNGQQQGGTLSGQTQNVQQQGGRQRGQRQTNTMLNVNGMQSQFRSING